MKKIHITVLAIVMLLMVSLVFAQQGQETYVSGDISAQNTPAGVVVSGEQVAVTVPISATPTAKRAQAAHTQAVHRTQAAHANAVRRAQAVNQQAASVKATQVQNAASLKKAEPNLKVNTTTTETDVYDVNVKNKRGTTNYGIVEQTVTNPKGRHTTEGVVYESYQPSKMALVNAKKMEVSLAGGATMSYNKDDQSSRYGSMGFAAGVSSLYDVNDYLALGLDYMMLHPKGKTHGDGVAQRHYHGIYAHNVALAGKLTLMPWDSFQIYSPMGVGMMNARMKTDADGVYQNDNKWGASFYVGLGMQYDITCQLFAGLEYRYTYAFVSDKDLTVFHKDSDLQFHTVMMRLGMRF